MMATIESYIAVRKALALCLRMAENGYDAALNLEDYDSAQWFRETLAAVEELVPREEIVGWCKQNEH